MNPRPLLSLGLALPLLACSGASNPGVDGSGGGGAGGSSAYDPLFSAPGGSATADQVYGLWGGSAERAGTKFDIRMRLEDGRITLAGRCTFKDGTTLTTGTSGSARVATKADSFGCFSPKGHGTEKPTCGSIEILESKTNKQTLGEKFCTVELKPMMWRYALTGMDLVLSTDTDDLELVKLSD
jgi:hypothetical protein